MKVRLDEIITQNRRMEEVEIVLCFPLVGESFEAVERTKQLLGLDLQSPKDEVNNSWLLHDNLAFNDISSSFGSSCYRLV